MPNFVLRKGRAPLLVSVPHCGTVIPPVLSARMTPVAQHLDDTDWHVDVLYDFAASLDASMLVAAYSRYVIDLNRPPDNANLYPGQDTTGLCPVDTFSRELLYPAGKEPDEAEIEERRKTYWQPYHDALQEELTRIRDAHGYALLWDAHSIRSEVPRFFQGRLPDLNFGTNSGASCGVGFGEALLRTAGTFEGYTSVLNGRFKGGYITRHNGRPKENFHSVQLEMAQCTYMEEMRPYRFREDRASALRDALRALIGAAMGWKFAER
jgi:N-formylglutamate deformylase